MMTLVRTAMDPRKFCRKSKVWAIGLERNAPIVDELGEFVEADQKEQA